MEPTQSKKNKDRSASFQSDEQNLDDNTQSARRLFLGAFGGQLLSISLFFTVWIDTNDYVSGYTKETLLMEWYFMLFFLFTALSIKSFIDLIKSVKRKLDHDKRKKSGEELVEDQEKVAGNETSREFLPEEV